MTRPLHLLFGFLLVAAVASAPSAQQSVDQAGSVREAPALKATDHPRLPDDPSRLWMVPKGAHRTSEFADAVRLEVDGSFAKALPILSKASLQQGPLGDYALYYQAFAEMRLGRPAEARRLFQTLQSKSPVGYIAEGAALREAECDEALGDQAAALEVYERLARGKTTAPDEVLIRLARAARAVGAAVGRPGGIGPRSADLEGHRPSSPS